MASILTIVPHGKLFQVIGPKGVIARTCRTRAAAEDFVRTWELLLGGVQKLGKP